MKKLILIWLFLFSASTVLNAQFVISSIQDTKTELILNDSISIEKGGNIQAYLPLENDFLFIKPVKKFNAKLLGKVADAVGTGASAVGLGSGNIKILSESIKVARTANAVQYGVDALDKIQELPISKNAKKIADQNLEVIDWQISEDGYILNTKFDKKNYQIYLQEALLAGEIKLKNDMME